MFTIPKNARLTKGGGKTPKDKTIVRKGLFRLSLGDDVKKYRAVDETEAKLKFLIYLGINGIPCFPTELDIEVIEPTVRELI